MLSVGVYPQISLKNARARRESIRGQVALGIDPSGVRKAEKRARANTFEAVAREWWDRRKEGWSDEYRRCGHHPLRAGHLSIHRLKAGEQIGSGGLPRMPRTHAEARCCRNSSQGARQVQRGHALC